MNPDLLKRIERTTYVLAALAAGVGGLAFDTRFALGLSVGGLIGALNFSAIRWLVARATQTSEGKSNKAALLFVPKMSALIGVVFLAIWFLPMSSVAFAIGFSLFFVAILIETTWTALRGSAPDDADASDGTPR
jgi:hypothetical protein